MHQGRERMAGQNSIIKKLCSSLTANENAVVNQRFTFYKMLYKDTLGNSLLPTKGPEFQMLNQNLLQGTAEKLQSNLYHSNNKDKGKRCDININVAKVLDCACIEIQANYKDYLHNHDKLSALAPITESFHLERVQYNR